MIKGQSLLVVFFTLVCVHYIIVQAYIGIICIGSLNCIGPFFLLNMQGTWGRKTSHNIFSSEPQSPHFLVQPTSKFSSFH